MQTILRSALCLSVAVVVSWSRPAEACGCFVPPDPVSPIVQAGERILFAVKDGTVTAHIQIQYAGAAKDFGWLLPLPGVPKVSVGTNELFTQLLETTQPTYLTQQTFDSSGCPRGNGGGCNPFVQYAPSGGFQSASAPLDAGPSTPLVSQDSIGPYEYAVLKADDKTQMLQWLADNRYFVPGGTDAGLGPYIHPGAYFLALKLKSGAATGDITPVVLEYPSQLPMIPLILSAVAAQPNMGIQVWLVGNARGIPRNFHHVVLNDALLDWTGGVSNYSALVTRAVAEAPEKHAFVTEYAGTSAVMRDRLAPPTRFGTEAALAQETTRVGFVRRLYANGFTEPTQELPANVVRLLLTQIPMTPGIAARSVSVADFYRNLDFYFGDYRDQNPADFAGYPEPFDAPTLAAKLFAEHVKPIREANALFTDFPTLTRLFTTLSPEDMTADPVFSFNADLPEVKPDHTAVLKLGCPTTLVTEQGWRLEGVVATPPIDATPVALRVETLGEEGPARVVTDNTAVVHTRFAQRYDAVPSPAPAPQTGCSTVDPMSLGLLVLMASLRRRQELT